MKLHHWLFIFGGLALVAPIVIFQITFYNTLWQIKHKPLPPVARAKAHYTIRDLGAATGDEIAFYLWSDERFIWQLTDEGKAIHNKSGADLRRNSRLEQGSERLQHLGLPAEEFTSIHDISGEWTLVHRSEMELWRGKKLASICPMKVEAYLNWPTPTGLSHFFGTGDMVIGNSRIATAFASSGGVSSPHGRDFPFAWNGKSQFLLDLNCEIEAENGWYLYSALAANSRGQILCLGEQTDALSAETSNRGNAHKLILTPIGAPAN